MKFFFIYFFLIYSVIVSVSANNIKRWYVAEISIMNEEYWKKQDPLSIWHHLSMHNGEEIIALTTKKKCSDKINKLHMRAVTMHANGHNIFEVEAKVEDIVLAHYFKQPYLVITWEHMKTYYQCFNFPLTLSDRDTPIPVVPVD